MNRVAKYPIADFILNRHSPRAMSGEAITDFELMTLLEAAHWAPSSYNNQPWRFVYALKNTPDWQKFFDFNNQPSRTHSFDTGAAWENLSLQGYLNNLVVHGMEGFDYEKAAQLINLPKDYTIDAMAAIGKPGKLTDLSPELQAKEVLSSRKSLTEVVFAGKMVTS